MADRRTLILMRHATAGHQGATRDHDRPLTEHGRREAAAAGRWILASLPAVDAVLCSTATRTRQTLAASGIPAPVSYQERLYGGGIDDIVELLHQLPSTADTVLVIGHAPGIPAAAAALVDVATSARSAGRDHPETDGAETDDADDANTDDQDSAAAAGPLLHPEHAALRRFSAGALAVLSTEAQWPEIADQGADLVTVRLPD